jgi:sulfur-oxidizing protein SoxY
MPTRRDIITGGAALAAATLLTSPALLASEDGGLDAAIAARTGGAAVTRGRVLLGIPGIAENGFSVFTTIEVDSPMTSTDHVKAIHLFSEKNPVSHIASFHLGARAGRAKVATNIRLATSQTVTAIAEMSDGSFWSDRRDVVVTIAACIDGG